MESRARPCILSVSYDSALLRSRQLVLETRGYKVISAKGFEQGIAECRETDRDLLIIGHSVPSADKAALIQASKQRFQSPILALVLPGESPVEGATKSLEVSYQPDALLAIVDELLGR